MRLSASLRRPVALVGLFTSLPRVLASGQVPIVDGVIGAVPRPDTLTTSTPAILAATGTGALSSATTPGQLRVVENSGVCETTPGVYQASGYGDLTANQSLWSVGAPLLQLSILTGRGYAPLVGRALIFLANDTLMPSSFAFYRIF